MTTMTRFQLVAAVLLAVAMCHAQAVRTFPYDSCLSGDSVIQYVGSAGGNAAGCIWAGLDVNSEWFSDCVKTWMVSVNKCEITMTPTVDATEDGCPCW
jgi:hypothetical protein